MIEMLRRNRILSVIQLGNRPWRHPWHHLCVWNVEMNRWEADIQIGFVNGLDATIELPVNGSTVDVPLSEHPKITLPSWRAIGMGAAPTDVNTTADGKVKIGYEAVPDFFLELGVAAAPSTVVDGDTMINQISGLMGDESQASRLLRACEVILYCDREVALLEMNPESPITGRSADYFVRYSKMPGSRDRAYLQTSPRWTPMSIGLSLMVPRAELHLATVYMVSPPNTALDSDPDENWSPYVQHHCFWNLSHRSNTPEPETPTHLVTLQTGLAGGVGDAINQYLLVDSNDSSNQLIKQLQELMIDSRFWTV